MSDSVEGGADHLSHDMLCQRCGHAYHTFLACDDSCDCRPALMPGERRAVTA